MILMQLSKRIRLTDNRLKQVLKKMKSKLLIRLSQAVASYPGHVSEGKVAWRPLFAHARTIPEIFREQVRIWTSYTWLLCGEITKLDIRLAVWELCLRGDRFSVVSILLRLASYPGHVPSCQILHSSQQLLVSYSAAVTNYSSADSTALRLVT